MARTPTHDDSPKLSDALAALAARIDDALGESGERIAWFRGSPSTGIPPRPLRNHACTSRACSSFHKERNA